MNLEPIFDFGNAGWNIILERFGRLITADYPSYQFYHAFIERQSPQPWRDELVRSFSILQEVKEAVDYGIQRNGAVLLKGLGNKRSPEQQARILYLISVLLGRPMAADKVSGQVVWDIRQRTLPVRNSERYYSTFSEGSGEAPFHTDTSFYPEPAEVLGLMCIKPARCGGGINRLTSLEDLMDKLHQSENLWALEYLASTPMAFRIPGAFTYSQSPEIAEIIKSTVLADKPGIRLRLDSMIKGAEYYQHDDYQEAMRAVFHLMQLAEQEDIRADLMLEEGDILLMNNHDLIHYRSAFQDIQRHLLRIWVAQGEQVQSRPPGVISYQVENTLSARHKASAPYAMAF